MRRVNSGFVLIFKSFSFAQILESMERFGLAERVLWGLAGHATPLANAQLTCALVSGKRDDMVNTNRANAMRYGCN